MAAHTRTGKVTGLSSELPPQDRLPGWLAWATRGSP